MSNWLIDLVRHRYRGWLRRQTERIPFAARGRGVEIVPRCTFENPENIRIGDWVFINHGCAFHGVGGLTIGSNISFSPRVEIHTSNHRFDNEAEALPYDRHTYLKPVTIASHCWIGAHALICPGVTIGEGAVVAMGSVVTRDVPPLTVVGGNPAREIRRRDPERFERLKREERFHMRDKLQPGYPGPVYLPAPADVPEALKPPGDAP